MERTRSARSAGRMPADPERNPLGSRSGRRRPGILGNEAGGIGHPEGGRSPQLREQGFELLALLFRIEFL
ncbi:MAG: hypothetical protein ACKOCD_03185, partial [Nitrospiraceae bacterium]